MHRFHFGKEEGREHGMLQITSLADDRCKSCASERHLGTIVMGIMQDLE